MTTNSSKNFALIGAAGYIAPRHMQAIKATGNRLVAALDPKDSVGIIDRFFPEADFFVEFERFDRHIDKLRRTDAGQAVDYVSICSPNYLHDSHIRFALRSGADAICEKPLVLNPWNIDALVSLEKEMGRKIYTILQLRLHNKIIALRNEIKNNMKRDKKFDVDLTYITSRGHWYFVSWKGNELKSGGIATNIGIHFFDMLYFLFGAPVQNTVHKNEPECASGFLEFENARVRWFLSVSSDDLPAAAREKGLRTYRSIRINGEEVEFSGGFEDLHVRSYQHILEGKGFGPEDCRVAIELVAAIRTSRPTRLDDDAHPFAHPRLSVAQ